MTSRPPSPLPREFDAVVVGAGPNGLAAAIEIARAGHTVLVQEAKDTIGGGCRSAELTLPGFVHDLCSAIHPLALASPFFRMLPLGEHGLEWIQPPAALAHPFDDGTAAVLYRSTEATGETLGVDAQAYRRFMQPLVDDTEKLLYELLGPLHVPRYPLAFARAAWLSVRSAKSLATSTFQGERARALFGGLGAHSMMPLEQPLSAGFGIMLGLLGHAVGWPIPRGGSQQITDALASYLRALGGKVCTGAAVAALDDVPPARATIFDLTPRSVRAIAGARLPRWYRNALERYRYGPGVFKIDYALDGPVPWAAPECLRAGTVHLGGTLDEIALAERAVWQGQPAERPFVLLAQQSLFDCTRAPEGKHTLWAYCHVPSGSTVDMSDRIERQIERFAPGFRARILARSTRNAVETERHNANYVGGDINGGVQDIGQLFTRPAVQFPPYVIPAKGLYICSSATPPGGGVHGMCGFHAAQAALKRSLRN